MRFRQFHNDFFASSDGAYSIVTDREFKDSQITLTDVEAELVIHHFGLENIQIGNVKSNPQKASKQFYLYSNKKVIHLNLVFPKPEKPELRLYISSGSGFKPSAGHIWFIYISKSNHLVVGNMEERLWNSLNQEDGLDADYQKSIEKSIASGTNIDIDPKGRILTRDIGNQTIFDRDPRLATMRFQLAGYRCEIDPLHETFIAQRTNLPYVEAHHFIPIKFQHLFTGPLDNLSNIVALCPNCHRGIHHAVIGHKYDLITKLYEKRQELQVHSIEDIAQYYNAIRITDS